MFIKFLLVICFCKQFYLTATVIYFHTGLAALLHYSYLGICNRDLIIFKAIYFYYLVFYRKKKVCKHFIQLSKDFIFINSIISMFYISYKSQKLCSRGYIVSSAPTLVLKTWIRSNTFDKLGNNLSTLQNLLLFMHNFFCKKPYLKTEKAASC